MGEGKDLLVNMHYHLYILDNSLCILPVSHR